MKANAAYWIGKLNLLKHPEGGYYKEVYRSSETITHLSLPLRFKGNRCFSTSIYFLLESDDFSAFHRIQSEEIWHFYKGCSLTIYIISEDGILTRIQLGDNPAKGEEFQVVVPHNTWFAAQVNVKKSFSLVGCTVAPGFDFDDFELADYKMLCNKYPQHTKLIKIMTIN